MNTNANIRKAAVLLRSLDADTAATMLGQLSADEAVAVRVALRDLGPLDDEEQADVAAEFRRIRPMVGASASSAVELTLSSSSLSGTVEDANPQTLPASAQRFDFLAGAPTAAVVGMLVREHAQTVAVVLAHLAPERAASILAALPERVQADAVERLSMLGETDSECVTVIERELALWLATRTEDRGTLARRRESVTKILAAADPKTRRSIVRKLTLRGAAIADSMSRLNPLDETRPATLGKSRVRLKPAFTLSSHEPEPETNSHRQSQPSAVTAQPFPPPTPARVVPQLRVEFDQLVHLDPAALSAVLRDVDASVLALALVGSREELVDRITDPMPKRMARIFRRELRRIGPTKLSDVEGAQQIVADTAARYLTQRRQPLLAVGR